MQPLAAWLVARPLNGGMGLVLALVLPMLTSASSGLGPVIAGLVMTHLVFAGGVRMAVIQGAGAGFFLALLAVILNASVGQIVATASLVWIPAIVLAAVTMRLRSLTLMLQVTVLLAMAGVLAFYIVLGNPVDYWNELITQWIALVREAGQSEYADQLVRTKELILPQMTMMAVFTIWTWLVLVLLLGYGLYQSLPEKLGVFGRFPDLNYGRVLAATMALTSLLALATGSIWLQNLAFIAFVVFWLQGLAMMHWLYGKTLLPLFVLVATYAFLVVPVLNGLIIIALAVFGYMDAWFNFRARREARQT